MYIPAKFCHRSGTDKRPVSDRFEWTAINSRERLAVLKHLPPQIPGLVGGESGDVF